MTHQEINQLANTYNEALHHLFRLDNCPAFLLSVLLGQPEEENKKSITKKWIDNNCIDEMLEKNFDAVYEKFNSALNAYDCIDDYH